MSRPEREIAIEVEPRLVLPDDDQPTIEQTIGHELTALIRSGDQIDDRARMPMVPYASTPPKRSAQPTRASFRLRPGRVADLVGVLLTAAGIWAGYQWVQALPERPSASPWSLLGTGISAAATGQADPGSGQTPEPEAAKRPLGQYVFNQSWEQRAPEDRLGRTRVVRYDRVQMLEAAFDVEYIPPPGCSDWATDADMVRCSNHRMRALRAFVESDGTVTPDMMGINDSVDAGRPPENASATSDWRWEQAQQGYGDPAQPWSRTWQQMESDDTTRDPGLWQEEDRDWEEAPSYPGEYWREQHTPGPKADSGSNWQEEPEPYSYSPEDWTRQRDWRQEQNRQTQTDQYPDEDWPARQEWRQDAAPDQMRQWSDDWRPQEYAPESGGWLWGQEGSRELSTPAPEGYE